MNLKEALASLDVANDEHWTQDGQPRLDVLGTLTGGRVTRSDLSPAFTRESQQPVKLDETEAAIEDQVVEDTLDADLAAAEEACNDVENYLGKAQVELTKRQQVRDDLLARREKRDRAIPGHSWKPIQEFLASEQRKRDARAAAIHASK